MLLKYFYDQALAHASYMVGCQATGEAIIVDPGRDIEQYLLAAEEEEMRIVGAAETHIHADYVSGARELADRIGAKLYVSDEGPADWKYEYADAYDHQLLKDGDAFMVGNVKLETMHTPGHTPESISFVLTDLGGGADKPMGVFTGDFVFVGSTGRPDLLEKAAGVSGNALIAARQMYHSLERFKALPDYLQVWPAHGAGSACGKGLGAVPSSTVGYEKMFNPALAYEEEDAFVNYLLADQPEAPRYFAVMKRVNKEGPALLGPNPLPAKLDVGGLKVTVEQNTVIDINAAADFARAHVSGTINMPMNYLAEFAGWFVDYSQPVYLIVAEDQMPEAVRILHKIGIDNIAGYYDAADVAAAGLATASYEFTDAPAVADEILNGDMLLVDVRGEVEWNEGHIPNATHLFLGTLPENSQRVVNGKPIVVSCRTGGRSAIGASLLKKAGAGRVLNLNGGIVEWAKLGLPLVK